MKRSHVLAMLFAIFSVGYTTHASAQEEQVFEGANESVGIGGLVDTIDGPRATGFKPEAMTLEEALSATYWEPTAADLAAAAATPTYDGRKEGYLTAVRDQGQCGSCWAHAIIAAVESVVKKLTGKALNLSEQELVSCSDAYGCDGGFMTSSHYVTDAGVTYESKYPYTARDSRCKSPLPARAVKKGAFKFAFVGRPGQKPPLAWIKAAIKKFGGGFSTVSAGGKDWDGSRVHMTSCGNRGTNHMIFVPGYSPTELLIRNSWSANWADKGYAWAPQGCDALANEGESFAVAIMDVPPPPVLKTAADM
jgi:C1A family cysteine protease